MVDALTGTKVCNKCRGEFPLNHFHRVKNKADGRRNTCPECRKIHEKQNTNKNTENKMEEWFEHDILAITQLRSAGISYPIIAKILKRSVRAVQQKAFKLGITTHDKSEENFDLFAEYSKFSELDSKVKGTISEQQVFIKFALNGFDVFTPFSAGTEEDCIIRKNNKYFRVQIKTASMTSDKRFRTSIMRKRNKGRLKGQRVRYDNIDFYVIFIPIVDVFYVVPDSETKDIKEVNLYPHRAKTIIRGPNWERYRDAFHLIE